MTKTYDPEPKIAGRADLRDQEKMTKLSTFAYAPRYVKFFNSFFEQPQEDGHDYGHDPLDVIEDEVAAWINKGLKNNIGYEILQAMPQTTKQEVIVTVLYRKFALY